MQERISLSLRSRGVIPRTSRRFNFCIPCAFCTLFMLARFHACARFHMQAFLQAFMRATYKNVSVLKFAFRLVVCACRHCHRKQLCSGVHVRTWGPPSLRWGGHPAQGYAPNDRNRNEVPAGVPYFSWALGEGASPSGYPPGAPPAPHNGIF